jgi:uncharacterized membrane protein
MQDDCPNETKRQFWVSINNIFCADIHQLYLQEEKNTHFYQWENNLRILFTTSYSLLPASYKHLHEALTFLQLSEHKLRWENVNIYMQHSLLPTKTNFIRNFDVSNFKLWKDSLHFQ